MAASAHPQACCCAQCLAAAADRKSAAAPDGPPLAVPQEASTVAGPSDDPAANSLISGTRWQPDHGGGVTITYSFASQSSVWRDGYGNDEPGSWAGDFSQAEEAVVRKALGAWAAVADIRFVEVADDQATSGDIRFGRSLLPSTAWAYLPGDAAENGDVWLGQQRFPSIEQADIVDWVYAPGSWRYFTLMHEVGHALGLLHTHDGGGVAPALDAEADWVGASIMSYRSHPGQAELAGYGVEFYPTTPMGLDVAAVQSLYGSASVETGDTRWTWAPDARIFQTIWDGGGNDTIDWSNQTSPAVIRLGQGTWSELGEPFRWSVEGGGVTANTLFIAKGSVIENATGGSADDRIEGSEGANRIDGRQGDDVLIGDGGSDALFGGPGDDRIEGGAGNDLISGNDGADRIFGQDGDDRLFGFSGEDRILGGNGHDHLMGGDDGDRLYGDDGDDWLDGGAGGDLLFGGIGDNRLDGGNGDDLLYGGGGADRLSGGSGDDVLNGGSGDDLLLGGLGDDVLIAWYGQDIVDGGAGIDTLEVVFGADKFRLEGTAAQGRLVDADLTDGDLGTDVLRSVEIVKFLDRTLTWDGGHWVG